MPNRAASRPMKREKVQRLQSLADRAFDAIEEMIVGGDLAPGALVSESELSQILKMGRTPIREAIARLKFIGFVDVHPRRGVSVSGVDVIRHLQVLEVRRPLEESLVRHAIERANPDDLAELSRASREVAQAGKSNNRINYFRAKKALHDVLQHRRNFEASRGHDANTPRSSSSFLVDIRADRKLPKRLSAALCNHRARHTSRSGKGCGGSRRTIRAPRNTDKADHRS